MSLGGVGCDREWRRILLLVNRRVNDVFYVAESVFRAGVESRYNATRETMDACRDIVSAFPIHSTGRINAVLSARPKVAELSLRLFGRSLHPELFQIHNSRTVQRGSYTVQMDITGGGHVITFRNDDGQILTEVAAACQQLLPSSRQLLNHRLTGARTDSMTSRTGVKYTTDFKLEPVEPQLFWDFQEQFSTDAERRGLLHVFEPSGRVPLGALSYINIESRERKVAIQAFHTFPDDCAIIKVQSSFELP